MNRFKSLGSIVRDLRFSVRLMVRSPGFTIAAVATLTLGIGANLALFTLLNAQFLRARSFTAPNEIYSVLPADSLGASKFFNLSRPYYDAIGFQTVQSARRDFNCRSQPTITGWNH